MAQTTGTLQGRIDGAQAGTAVTVTDTVTGRSTSTTIDANGNFVIAGLRPSTYRIEGAGQTEEVVLPVGQTVAIDLSPQADVAGADGEIVVTGRRGIAEVRTATIGVSVSQDQINNLPQNDRNFLNFAALAPGVTVSSDPNNKRIQAGGASSENVNVYIDGSSQKNQVGFGGVAGQNFSQGNPFPQSAVQEFRVETQNYKAEYEQAGSAIITAITKTGGDRLSGGAFVEFVPKPWFGRPFFDREGEANNAGFPCPDDASETCYNEKPDYKRYQFGANLGGPIIPGKLHFFAAYEGTRQTNPSIVVNVDPLLPDPIRQAQSGNFAAEFKQDLYFGKLTLFATDDDTFNASYFLREESDLRDYGGNRAFENGRNVGTRSENVQFEWNHRDENWLNEMTLSYFSSFTGTPTITVGPEYVLTNGAPGVDDDGDGIIDNEGDGTGADLFFFGANSFQQANDQSAYTFKNNFTYTGLTDHVIKYGLRVSQTKLTRIEDANANGSYRYAFQRFSDVDNSVPFRAVISLLPATPLEADNTQVGMFLQDDWTIDDHWTVNLGLRWDYESNNFNNNYVTPTKVANALRNYQPWEAAGIDPEDYITDGTKRDPFLGAFQPRIGVSYDVFGDRDLILFAGGGRYYDRNIFYTASLEPLFNNVRSDATIDFCGAEGLPACAGGANQLQWNPAYRDPQALRDAIALEGLSGDIWVINNDAKVPYTDQFNFGVRKRFGEVQTSIALAHNRSHDAFIFVRGNRMPDGNYTEGGDAWIRDNFPEEGRPTGYTGRLNIGSSNGEQRYTAVYLNADKPYSEVSGWGATASLTISDAKSNQGIGFNEAQMFNAGRQDAYGWQRTRGLESWRFVTTGIADIAWGFQASGTLTLASGPSFGNVDSTRTPPPNCTGCSYYNDGGVFTPKDTIAYKNLDVRLAKTFTLPWGHEVTADFEVFNVFDWVNRNYSTWGAGSGPNPTLEENATVGYARTFQVGLKYDF
ncbi:TonB-dependent receptor [Sphingomonas japonica]|uniref:Outer membrane receptor protein involved in Fe transport n=1 Tax=Sphingomonas japonica TaxID=511662 RepID=A0ABX0U1Q1_9SPHN|nr:TonB-dependent receptor [Sphingomonas japonica]NIJ23629.1 outer membrane receptor protein involved in Fe transport [Sphingomonas japonica]